MKILLALMFVLFAHCASAQAECRDPEGFNKCVKTKEGTWTVCIEKYCEGGEGSQLEPAKNSCVLASVSKSPF